MSIVKLNNNGVKNATAFGIVSSGSMTFIKKITASSSATLSFVDGSSDVVLDNTYKEYLFTFKNIHPATDGAAFTFQANASGGSGYNEYITSSQFQQYHKEDGSASGIGYNTSNDQAQGTSFQKLNGNIDSANDACGDGYLHLFNPSSTTFVKHFMSRGSSVHDASAIQDHYVAGYCNVTVAIDAVQFSMNSGNIDAGTIKLYGIKDS